MRFREIARELQVSINTVQGRYRYAMQKLRTGFKAASEAKSSENLMDKA
jgi:DNA-directed RNA polymerase specialized sigma24 family protein